MNRPSRLTCRDPRKDTLKLLRAEIHELLEERETNRAGMEEMRTAYLQLREQHCAFVTALSATIALADAIPIKAPCEQDNLPF